ncbi:class E sortase [Spirilliplanes yamanashiensis]|uniref:Uncharacterized protein n=1 Tax=Spirilliplanes yamanashiensis TaxID=42233 RepID=A0A8J4DIQ0_9ACTN|nr:class E sortase [Spirilliplanes yamanashiensis]MDP9814759.1 LPXTG-site transpeptidase (sortase) family protein [Spirilliplanes yamanashiensis]GIJ02413.1 hypothetical protein Sya03_17650 [Spirilliplanes yamanashiensis]
MRRRAWAVLAVVAALAGAAPVPAQAKADPAVAVSVRTARLGETVTARLTGWPAGVVTVALCGNEARGGSADCAVAASSAAGVPAGGGASVALRLAAPPVGCPCVVRAATATGAVTATAAIDVEDVPDNATVSLTRPGAGGTRTLAVDAVRVSGRWSLGALLGGPADRTLRVQLRNTGTAAVVPELSLDLGRAAGGASPAPVRVAALQPGEARAVEVPFTVAAPAVGAYDLAGRVDGADATVTFAARTSAWPWLLPVALPAFVLFLVGLRAVARARPSPLRLGAGTLITAGAACAAVLAVQTLAPGRETASAQAALDAEVRAQWTAPAEGVTTTSLDAAPPAPAAGEPMSVLHVPRWRAHYTVVEGVRTADLRKGPGHYPGTALPGQVGNMAVAGHRGPVGEPFNDIDRLRPGDPVVVETAVAWHVYRVERHVVVTPDRVDVVAETPERPGVAATRAMLTLTACHPRYSSRQRYVSFSVLEESVSKAEGRRPAALG